MSHGNCFSLGTACLMSQPKVLCYMRIGYWIVGYNILEVKSKSLVATYRSILISIALVKRANIGILDRFFFLGEDVFVHDPEDACYIVSTVSTSRDDGTYPSRYEEYFLELGEAW